MKRLPSDFNVEVEGAYVEFLNTARTNFKISLSFYLVSFEALNLLIQESNYAKREDTFKVAKHPNLTLKTRRQAFINRGASRPAFLTE